MLEQSCFVPCFLVLILCRVLFAASGNRILRGSRAVPSGLLVVGACRADAVGCLMFWVMLAWVAGVHGLVPCRGPVACRALSMGCGAGFSYACSMCRWSVLLVFSWSEGLVLGLVPCCGRRAVVCGCCGWCRMRFCCECASLSGLRMSAGACAFLVSASRRLVPCLPCSYPVLFVWAILVRLVLSSFLFSGDHRTMCRCAVWRIVLVSTPFALLFSCAGLVPCVVLVSAIRSGILLPYL